MKKMYENPIVEVLELEDADITTTSGGNGVIEGGDGSTEVDGSWPWGN